MSDEHEPHKLVAKIQYFYDIMVNVSDSIEDNIILNSHEKDKTHTFGKSQEIHKLISEYGKIFDAFLYKNPE